MSTTMFFLFMGLVALVISVLISANSTKEKQERFNTMSPDQQATALMGSLNEHLICPHCQTKGTVRAKSVSRTETSTGKVGGIVKTNTKSSVTKLVTQHHCDKCRTTWDV